MKAIKNIIVGFAVSFIGSIPLGYLNIIGFQIYEKSGQASLIYYLLGVICIEAVVIYVTLVFASRLTSNKKLIKYIALFSIFFMLLLSYIFYSQSQESADGGNYLDGYANYSSFIIGIVFSSLNFVQVPFWVGWNLYLINNNYISDGKKLRWLYLAGTLLGTFAGMFAFARFLSLIADQSQSLMGVLMTYVIPLFFVCMAIYQAIKFYQKYYRTADSKK